jgi:hypothetical protein
MRGFALLMTGIAMAATAAAGYGVSLGLGAENEQVTRGKYLVQLGGCTDCHTPGHFFGKPDMARYLGGSDMGSRCPGSVSLLVGTSRPIGIRDLAIGARTKS